MKAPVLVFQRTRAPSQGRGYLDASSQTAEAFGMGVAKGANALGGGLVDLATAYQQRNNQVSRLKLQTDFTDFDTQAITAQGELKRTAAADVTDFPKTARETFDKSAMKFMEPITDPILRAEVTAKMAELKQRITLDSFDFQYKQQDAFFKAGTTKIAETWRNRVYADRTQLEPALKAVNEAIDATALPPPAKIEMKSLFEESLRGASYGNEVNEISRKGVVSGPPPEYSEGAQSIVGKLVAHSKSLVGIELSPEQAAVVAGNMQQESGFRTWAHNEKEGAHGLIQWRLDRWDGLREAAKAAGKDWRDPNLQVDHFLQTFKEDYPEAWQKFITATSMTAMNAALKEYIRYGDDSAGTRLKNAEAILMGANPQGDVSRRDDTTPADLEALNNDPKYASVPLEQRLSMTAAADAQASEEAAEAAKASKAAIDAKLNDLFVGLHDGTYDATNVLNARKEGWLDQIEDIAKADQIMAGRQGEVDEAAMIQSTLDNGGAGYNRVTMNGEKNKGVNAWVGQDGLGKITAMDDEYMDRRLLPAIAAWDDIPTVAVGQLESMASSNNSATAIWALQRLQQIKDIAPNGFVARTTENRLGERVEAFRNLRGLFDDNAEGNKEMLSYVNGGTTPQAQRVMQVRDEEARKNLNKLSSSKFLKEIVPSEWGLPRFLGGYGGSQLSEDFEVSGAYELAGRELYIKNFRMTGDPDDAMSMTKRMLGERWGLSVVGDSTAKVPMEWPPEKVYAGTKVPMEVYADQIRREFKLTSDENYRLISDDTTYKEIGLAGRGQLVGPDGKPRLPSYRVKRITKNGNEVEEGRWFGDPVVPVAEAE